MGNKMIWIDEKLADKLEIINDVVKIQDEDINKIIKRLAEDTNLMTECLDENVLRFKLHAQQTRDSYKKVVEEEIEKTYELWEKCDELRSETKDKIKTLLPVISDVNNQLEKLDKSISKINTYGIDRLIDLVEKFKQIPTDEKQMLAKLLDYKKWD